MLVPSQQGRRNNPLNLRAAGIRPALRWLICTLLPPAASAGAGHDQVALASAVDLTSAPLSGVESHPALSDLSCP